MKLFWFPKAYLVIRAASVEDAKAHLNQKWSIAGVPPSSFFLQEVTELAPEGPTEVVVEVNDDALRY